MNSRSSYPYSRVPAKMSHEKKKYINKRSKCLEIITIYKGSYTLFRVLLKTEYYRKRVIV